MTSNRAAAILGGGCFWCLEAVYERIEGVESVVSGYSGGRADNPTYEEVCSGRTGHAEVVRITYDRDVISFRDLLEIFFTIHDPTTLNRQGADIGTQYRSVIYYLDPEQKRVAEEVIRELEAEGVWSEPIVTEVARAGDFFTAEEYHQGYYRRNPAQPYCQVVIAPKLAKLRDRWRGRLRSGSDGSTDSRIRPYQTEPANPVDQGGIAE